MKDSTAKLSVTAAVTDHFWVTGTTVTSFQKKYAVQHDKMLNVGHRESLCLVSLTCSKVKALSVAMLHLAWSTSSSHSPAHHKPNKHTFTIVVCSNKEALQP